MLILKRILIARPEVQAATIATFNLISLHPSVHFDQDFQSGLNIALTTWFAVAAKVAFGKDIEDLNAA